jgi:hypothetical protein
MRQLSYITSRADSDVWIKHCISHWEYVCTLLGELVYAGKISKSYFDSLCSMGYILKGIEEPVYHLGGDFCHMTEPESILTWGSHCLTMLKLIY